jgi:hypothetical protein
LVELAKGRAEEIARLDPKTNAEFEIKEAKFEAQKEQSGLNSKPDTSVPVIAGTTPYQSNKQPIMEKNYRLDKKTNRLYNIKTLKYFDVKTGLDSEKDYVPEAEPVNITIPEEIILPTIYKAPKKVEHKIQFKTNFNMDWGTWSTILVIDGQEFPAVKHAKE